MDFRILDTVYDVIDNTESGLNDSILSGIASVARAEIVKNYPNAWNNFEIALHAIDSGKEMEIFTENIKNTVGTHIVGVWGVDDRIEESKYIVVAFDRGLSVECQSYAGDITECANLIVLDDTPTEEEVNAMYEDYIANYGEVLDAKYINGAV